LRKVEIAAMAGFVESVEARERGVRVLVRVASIGNLAAEATPYRVRVTSRDGHGLKPGDFIGAKVRLLPPPQAAWPGGYDFARDAYFRRVGAVGSILGSVSVSAPPQAPSLDLRIAAWIDAARNRATERIAGIAGGQAGAVAAALVTGKRGLISEESNDALRAAGIYHIVSISGLHMVLAAGTVFWLVRAILALVPALALAWPVKKIAALVAMAGATAYCVFSGSEVATERSLIMTLVMLGAILADRPALSLRNLALAAILVLALEPETLLGPSFQMSFGAVGALTAAAEWMRGRRRQSPPPANALERGWRWFKTFVLGLLGTTLVASLATAPFGIFHFQATNPFGLLGNAMALPLVSVVVMPSAVLGAIAYPFGLDGPFWWLMGLATHHVLTFASWVEDLSGSTLLVPAFGPGALGLLATALIVLVLFRTGLRIAAVAPLTIGLWLAANPQRHDVFVDRAGAGAAVRAADGRLVILGRPGTFVTEQWLRADGDPRAADDASLRQGVRCDPAGCVAALGAPDSGSVAYVTDQRAFAEDCARALVVITRLNAPDWCRANLVFDRARLENGGAVTIRVTADGHAVTTARRANETRPWLAQAAPKPVPVKPPVTPPRPARPSPGELPDAEDLPEPPVSSAEPD
jgi:competence protein ComEC